MDPLLRLRILFKTIDTAPLWLSRLHSSFPFLFPPRILGKIRSNSHCFRSLRLTREGGGTGWKRGLVARYDLRPRKSLLGGPWNTIATRRRKEKRRRRRPSLSGSSLPRATGFAYSPLRLTRWRIYIMHPRCDGSWRKCNGNISPLARGAGTHGRSGGSCGWLVVHVCAG